MKGTTYSLNDVYDFYVERQKKKKRKHLKKKEFKSVAYMCNKLIIKEILKGMQVSLPFTLGILRIVKRKTNPFNLKLDFKHYNETGQKKYHLNEHSDGWYGRWHWIKFNYRITNLFYYQFIPTDDNKRAMSKVFFVKDGHKRFSE